MLNFLLLFKREFLRMAARPVYWFVMVIAPLGVYTFFVLLMQKGLPSELPIGLVDLDRTATTRNIARNLDAFQRTKITASYTNISDARQAMQRGDIYAFFLIPKGASRHANRQEQATVSFYVNYSYLIAASLSYQDLRMMSELASGGAARKILFAKGVSEAQAMAYLQPVVMDTHPINNPWLNYNIYLSNTIIPGMLFLFISLLTAYSLGTEIKDGTARKWMELAGGSIKKAVWGKLIPQFTIFWLMGAIYVLLFYAVLHFPCHCGIPTMLVAMTTLVLAGQGLGLFFFSILPSLRMSMSLCALWGVLSFSMCGMSFPVMAMHPAIQNLSLLFPLRHYFLIYINCALDGFPWQYATWNFIALILFAFLPILLIPRLKYSVLNYTYVP